MGAFEPSTWAEVEEAEATGKSVLRPSSPLVSNIVRFTNAPERCITEFRNECERNQRLSRPRSPNPEALNPPELDSTEQSSVPQSAPPNARYDIQRAHLLRPKRNNLYFEDLLQLGRVNLQTQALIRRRNPSSSALSYERSLADEASKIIASTPSPVNPSSTLYDPDAYLSRVHCNTSRNELVKGLKNISNLIEMLDKQADQLRSRSFPSVCLVAAELKNTKDLLRNHAYSQHQLNVTSRKFLRAEDALSAKYSSVIEKEKEIERLRRALIVLNRFDWVFSLGSRMKKCRNESVDTIEGLAREYVRGREWLETQDPGSVLCIEKDMSEGLDALVSSLTEKLGTGKVSRAQMKRIISILSSLQREPEISQALERRMSYAIEKLESASRTGPISAVFDIGDARFAEADANSLVKSATGAFVSGLSNYWRLACVVASYESCQLHMKQSLPVLAKKYSKIIMDVFSKGSAVLSRESVAQIMRAHRCALLQLEIPREYISELAVLTSKVVIDFIRSTARAVESSARQVAVDSVANESIYTDAAALVHSVALEAVSQVEDIVFKPQEPKSSTTNTKQGVRYVLEYIQEQHSALSAAIEELKASCVRALAFTAQALGKSLEHESKQFDITIYCVQVAVFCVNAADHFQDTIIEHVSRLLGDENIHALTVSARNVLEQSRLRAVRTYVDNVSPILEIRAKGLATYLGHVPNSLGVLSRTALSRSVSSFAPELLLELCLACIDVRKRGGNKAVVSEITSALVSRVGNTIANEIKSRKAPRHHVIQVWIDCKYLEAVLSSIAFPDGPQTADFLSGFSVAQKEAINRAVFDGQGFSVADRSTVEETAVYPAVKNSSILQKCLEAESFFDNPTNDIPLAEIM